MALDGIFLYHLKNEISQFAVDSRVDKLHQPSRDEIVLSLRSRQGSCKLLISCNADSARIHFTQFAPENPPKPPVFCLMLRKRLIGARVVCVEQDNLERLLRINFDSTDELGDRVSYSLIVEIMGKYSNIILLDGEDKIIDSAKRVDESKSHIRTVLPGNAYVPPPPQDKLNIFTDDIDLIKERIASSTKSLDKAVMDAVKGVSPIVCREVENGLSIDSLRRCALSPVPTAVIIGTPKDFSFLRINQYGSTAQIKTYSTFSELLDFFYYERARLMRVRAKSFQLFKTIETLRERAVRKSINRTKELEDCRDKDMYRLYGDLISTNQYRLEKGVSFYELENYYDDNKIIRIPADPALTPSQNSAKYYKEYRKKKTAQSKLDEFIAEANEQARYLDTVADALSRAETDGEIAEIKEELIAGGYIKSASAKNKRQKPLEPMKYKTRDGFTVLVGRNNLMNDRLTLKLASNYDTWFHTQDSPGSHIICKTAGTSITDTAVHDCAVLAAYFSKARESSNVAVDYTIVKNVKKPNGAKPGFVIYDSYKTEYVTPTLEETEALKYE